MSLNALDVTATSSAHGARPFTVSSGTTATTNTPNELLFASLTASNTIGLDSNAWNGTPSASFTSITNITQSTASGEAAEKIVSATQTAGTGDSFGGGNSQTIYGAGVIATFKASPGNISDSVNFTDNVGKGVGKPLVDPLNLSDSLKRLFTGVGSGKISDTLNLVDTVTGRTGLSNRILSDTLNIVDSLSYNYKSTVSHFHPAAFLDTVNLADSLSRLQMVHFTLSDTLTLTDTLTRLRNVPVILSEVVNVVDSLTRLGPPAVPGSFAAVQDSANPQTAIDVSWTTNAGDNPSVINYDLEHSTDQTNWTQICTCTLTSFVDSGLTPAATYYYRIRAYNGNPALGYSAYSALITQSTQTNQSGAGNGGGATPPSTYSLVVLIQDLLGNPLQGASVNQGASSLLTNANGIADFGSLNGGSYTINVSASGCTTTSQPISLNSNHSASSPFTINIPCGTQTTTTTTTGTTLSSSSIDTTIEIILGFGLAGMAIALIANERNKKKKKRERGQ